MIYNIQILRAIAALLVVHGHATGSAGFDLRWYGGANGVDLFFVISGFIIAYVGAQDSDRFLTRRLIRIVPIYWTSTLVLYLLVLVVPQYFRTTSSDPELLVRSLLFVPSSTVHTSDGIPHPTLGGGWTLNYEMYFYVVFSVALLLSRRWATAITCGALLVVVTVVSVMGLRSSAVASFYGNPIVVEFMLGMIAFHLVRAAETSAWWRQPRAWMRYLLLLTVVGGMVCLAFSELLFGAARNWLTSGIPAFFVVLSALLLERLYDAKITNRTLVLVGDASYVLYLIHVYVLYGVLRAVLGTPHLSELSGQLVSFVLMGLCTVPAVLIYRYYELPILRVLKARLLPRKERSRPVRGPEPSASAR
ncbi:MAG: acyltransferase [Kofleriaceae bacterium]|nr:acyltransferase [Kofleriaceae bacterium]